MPSPRNVLLIASGDLRLTANQNCWPAQQEMEQRLAKCRRCGRVRTRAQPTPYQARRAARLHRLAAGRDRGLQGRSIPTRR